MPYIPGSGGIDDVYHSGNVYANNVPIALWQDGVAAAVAAAISAYINDPEFATDEEVQQEQEGIADPQVINGQSLSADQAVNSITSSLTANGTISQSSVTAGSQAGSNAARSDTTSSTPNNGSPATTPTPGSSVDATVLYVSPAKPSGTGITYTVASVTKQPGVVFPYDVATVAPQNGTTVDAVVQNLANLVKNCFDPIKMQYPDAFMTCSFRPLGHGAAKSQHIYGMACDIQYAQASKADYYTRAQWVRDNVPYDQFILEYKTTGTGKPWHHISFNPAGNRGQVLTFMNDKNANGPGTTGLFDLSNA
jgi:hypothetical protein